MKRIFLLVLAAGLAGPAWATKVTNLDYVPHRVAFDSAGRHAVQELAPGETARFWGQPNGFLSLMSASNPKPSRGRYHADGLLRGVIGEERTEGIPADSLDEFVIWPDGTLTIQKHALPGRRR